MTLLDITERWAPDGLEAAHAALAADLPEGATGEAQAAFEATWAAMGAARQGSARDHASPSSALPPATPSRGPEDPRWVASQAALQTAMPEAEYTTWIAPLVLLHIEEALMVIAAPNCFVRDELLGTYARALQDAVDGAWGRRMAVEVVIDMAVLA